MLLIAYDGSADAKAAIQHAGKLMPNSAVTVLTIWEPFTTMLARTPETLRALARVDDGDEIDRESADGRRGVVEGGRGARTRGWARRHVIHHTAARQHRRHDHRAGRPPRCRCDRGRLTRTDRDGAAAGQRFAVSRSARRPNSRDRPLIRRRATTPTGPGFVAPGGFVPARRLGALGVSLFGSWRRCRARSRRRRGSRRRRRRRSRSPLSSRCAFDRNRRPGRRI